MSERTQLEIYGKNPSIPLINKALLPEHSEV